MIINGDSFTDQRGTIRFVNDFDFEGVKRFYTIYHPYKDIVRAWQGHKLETKYFYVIKGKFKLSWIKVDDWQEPSKTLTVHSEVLSPEESKILVVHAGHANGIRSMESNSILMIFSDLSLDASKNDSYRFDSNYWEI